MKRIHIFTAALLATSLAAPAAFAQTNTGSSMTGGNGSGMSNGSYSNGSYNSGYNSGGSYGNNGYSNRAYGGRSYGNSGYSNGGSGYGYGGNGYNTGNANGANGYNNASYGSNGGNGGGSMGNNVGAGAVLTVAPSGVREVQQALNRLGYQAGPINGVWDRQTANAMLNFQQAHGLAPTGNLNLSSVAGLGLWNNVIGNPIGNGNHPLANTNGSPPPRGNQRGVQIGGGRPMPSQRIVNGSADVNNNGGNGGGQ